MGKRTMMTDDESHAHLVDKRKQYKRPSLREYGSVKSLTAGGNSLTNESGAGGGTERRPTGSDRSIKENIVQIGVHPLGIGLYLFDYKLEYREAGDHGRQFGVMADEVQAVRPEAVSMHPDGYKMVNYAMLGISRTGV